MIQGARAGAERVFEILDTAPDLVDGTRELARADVKGAIRYEDVHFGYDRTNPILRGVSFEAAPGALVAIVGATGAGKTTLVSLIPRFYDVQAGRVLLDGIDVREFKLRSLRSQVAMVLSRRSSFRRRSARTSPTAGRRRRRTRSRARPAWRSSTISSRACRRAWTRSSARGAPTLSSGEQLRVTIARAILRDAPLLILDEPTAALDVETEARVMAGLENLMGGRTTFVIAHRLSTVRRATSCSVLDQGRVAESGSFAELVQRGRALRAPLQDAVRRGGHACRRVVSGCSCSTSWGSTRWRASPGRRSTTCSASRSSAGTSTTSRTRARRRTIPTPGTVTGKVDYAVRYVGDVMRRFGSGGPLGLPRHARQRDVRPGPRRAAGPLQDVDRRS
jgi:ABC-type transport system involved in cytochrome bd biosynthesis fused ATPase/permease subunit